MTRPGKDLGKGIATAGFFAALAVISFSPAPQACFIVGIVGFFVMLVIWS